MKFFIGTSGWLYKDWAKRFYTEDIKDKDKLKFLSENFNSVEINSSFYSAPKASTFKKWASEVTPGFLFTVKFGRYVTHRKKLIMDDITKEYIRYYFKNMRELGNHLGALLVQLPPQLRCNNERLDEFLSYALKYAKRIKLKLDIAVEFRHETWFNDETYNILKRHNTAFVMADSSVWPKEKVFTADFSYVRLHGPKELFASSYTKEQLQEWSSFMKSNKKIKKYYCYFNNDQSARAIENAKYLKEII